MGLVLVLATGIAGPGAAALPFDPVVNASGSPGDSRHPHLVIDAGGALHLAWADDSGAPGQYGIRYRRSFDRGQTFTSTRQISTGSGAALRPRLAAHGTAVYLVWHEDVSGGKDIMFSRSLDGGGTWQPPANLSRTSGDSREGRIAVGPTGIVYVVWDEAAPGGITLARSFDGGASFESPRGLFPVGMTRDCGFGEPTGACTPYPGLAVDPASGRVYLVWHDGTGTNFQIRFSRSLDGGNTFSAPLTLSGGAFHSHCAAISVGPSGRVLISYEYRKQADPHRHDAMFVQSFDGGASFTSPLNLSHGPGFAFSDYPWPAEAPNGLIVVGWEDNTAGGELEAVVAVSTDGGATFGALENISNNGGSTSTELVTLFGPDGTLYVVWEDYQNGQAEVFFRRAVGAGAGGGGGGGGAGGGGGTGSGAFLGGVYVAAADLTGDGIAEIITGAGPGGGPHVRVFLETNASLPPSFFAYAPSFPGGVRVAACDLDLDGVPEIVVAPGPGGGPHVRVFKVSPGQSAPLAEIASFYAYGAGFTGGVYVACGDLDGDGRPEIVTGAGEGGGPHVRAFRFAPGTGVVDAGVSFLAYAAAFTGGVRVAVGNVEGGGVGRIITAAGPGGGPHVRVFRHDASRPGGIAETGLEFLAYAPTFTGGVFVAAGDLDGDGVAEIVTGADAGGGPHVQVFSASGVARAGFFAYDPGFPGGVRVAVGPRGGAGVVVTAPGPGGGPDIRTFTLSGVSTGTGFFAY